MKVFEALARVVADEGVTTVFTLVGQANMRLVGALDKDPRTKVVAALHEGVALGMAEGCRRASGEPTVCIVTGGAALVNCALNLVEAVRSRTPLVVITGRTPPTYRGSPQTFDHRILAATVGVGYEEITDAGHVTLMAHAAFARAEAERRPIVLDIASDLQVADLKGEYFYHPVHGGVSHRSPPVAAATALAEAASLIQRHQRPVVVAGLGAAGARDEVLMLAERIGALVATTLPMHGWFGDNPYDLGTLGFFAWPFTLELIHHADCIIGIGASLNRYTGQDIQTGGLSFSSDRVVQIGLDEPTPLGDDGFAACFIQGDARASVAALTEMLAPNPGYRGHIDAEALAEQRRTWDTVVFDIEPDRMDPRQLCLTLDRMLPANCGVTYGTGHSWAFPVMYMTRWRSPQLFTYHFGSIGVSSAIGIGGALGVPASPMVIFEGDGSALMNIHSLQTMARENLPVLLVVLNDAAYGAELHQLLGAGLEGAISELPPTDIAALSASFGVRGVTVDSLVVLEEAVTSFLADPRPMVLDCRISRRVISIPSRQLDYHWS